MNFITRVMKRLLHNVGSYHRNTRVIFQATMKQMQDGEHERFYKVLSVRLGEIGLEIARSLHLCRTRVVVDSVQQRADDERVGCDGAVA